MKRILALVIAALALLAGWRVAYAEIANFQLQGDLHELASSQSSFRFGNVPQTDDAVRDAVIRKAVADGVDLQPDQVTVQRSDDRPDAPLYLAADYSVPVQVAQYSFVLHFTPSSTKSSF